MTKQIWTDGMQGSLLVLMKTPFKTTSWLPSLVGQDFSWGHGYQQKRDKTLSMAIMVKPMSLLEPLNKGMGNAQVYNHSTGKSLG